MRNDYEEDAKKFKLGSDKDKEDFIKKHGIDEAMDVLGQEIEATKDSRGAGTGGSSYHDELNQWMERLLERKNDKKRVPMSQAAYDLGAG